MSAPGSTGSVGPATAAPPAGPFRHPVFAVIWIATVVANIGSWMYTAAAGWLMTSLDPSPLMVSLVQVADSLPMLLLAIPAGAFADIIDKRRLLIGIETGIAVVSTTFAALVWFQLVTAPLLLLFMFLIGAGAALTAPSWQSIVPMLVPKSDLTRAVAANSVGVNISRAIGPALGGGLIALFGIAAPFGINGVSNVGTIGALLWWRPPPRSASRLPAENFFGAMRTGIRHARANLPLRATLVRALAFFPFASAYWALLPLVSRTQIAGGPELYGILLGTIGAGAVVGATFMHRLRVKLGADGLVAAGTAGSAIALLLYGIAREPLTAIVASLLAGMSWIAVLASLNVSAQVALPNWVRGRGLAIYVTVMFGGLTMGSAVWGEIAGVLGLPDAHFIAAAGCLVFIPLTRRWKLQAGADFDFMPSMHWPAPIVALDVEGDRGPVLVTVEYFVTEANRDPFLAGMDRIGRERQRDGAYSWGIFEDVAQPGRFVETFLLESWLEHLRQHERVTNADRVMEESVRGLLAATPKVTHFVAPAAEAEQ
jgi:MFS family permease